MSKAPEQCLYCDGNGNSSAEGSCGFCIEGKPSDTQEDWDNSWGGLLKSLFGKKEYKCGCPEGCIVSGPNCIPPRSGGIGEG